MLGQTSVSNPKKKRRCNIKIETANSRATSAQHCDVHDLRERVARGVLTIPSLMCKCASAKLEIQIEPLPIA